MGLKDEKARQRRGKRQIKEWLRLFLKKFANGCVERNYISDFSLTNVNFLSSKN